MRDGAEDGSIGILYDRKALVGKRAAGPLKSPVADIDLLIGDVQSTWPRYGIEHAQRRLGDLGADPIAFQDREPGRSVRHQTAFRSRIETEWCRHEG